MSNPGRQKFQKFVKKKPPRGRNSCKRNSGPLPVPLRFISFFLSSLDLWQGRKASNGRCEHGPDLWTKQFLKLQTPGSKYCAYLRNISNLNHLNLHTRLTWIEQSQTPQSLPPKHLLQRNLLSLARKWKSVVICQQYLVHQEIDGNFLYFVFSLSILVISPWGW